MRTGGESMAMRVPDSFVRLLMQTSLIMNI